MKRSVMLYIGLLFIIILLTISVIKLNNRSEKYNRSINMLLKAARRQNEVNKIGQNKYSGRLYSDSGRRRKAASEEVY